MKVYVDFSLFASDISAIGRVTGYLQLVTANSAKDFVLISNPPEVKNTEAPYSSFPASLKVQNIIISTAGSRSIYMVEDLIAPSIEDAKATVMYLKNTFGLEVEEYEG